MKPRLIEERIHDWAEGSAPEGPGCRRFWLQPQFVKGLASAGITYRSASGTIVSRWKRSGQARAKASADEAVDLSAQRYRAGTITLIDMLDAQRQQIAAEQSLSVAEASLTGDFIAIQKALGLGWSS